MPRPIPFVNADKQAKWAADTAASVDHYNKWFMASAPAAYLASRVRTTQAIERDFTLTQDLLNIEVRDLRKNPAIVRTLRMCTAPPIARDRLIGLAHTSASLMKQLEGGNLPNLPAVVLDGHLGRICTVIDTLLDRELFPWLATRRTPTGHERERAAMIVADRLCGADADPIIRNSQEHRQITELTNFLISRGYVQQAHPQRTPLTHMTPGTFCRLNVPITLTSFIPIDMAIQPKHLRPSRLPILIEAKSAGDFANTNKRRKEEADKMRHLVATLGPTVEYTLFLCGYFGATYLTHEAGEGIDWVWEHRIDDLDQFGI